MVRQPVSYTCTNCGYRKEFAQHKGCGGTWIFDTDLGIYECSSCDETIRSVSSITCEKCGHIRQYSNSQCFIATAAYGTPFDKDIDILREWRDKILNKNILGKCLVKGYYLISPPIAKFISNREHLKKKVRWLLRFLIKYLKKNSG